MNIDDDDDDYCNDVTHIILNYTLYFFCVMKLVPKTHTHTHSDNILIQIELNQMKPYRITIAKKQKKNIFQMLFLVGRDVRTSFTFFFFLIF